MIPLKPRMPLKKFSPPPAGGGGLPSPAGAAILQPIHNKISPPTSIPATGQMLKPLIRQLVRPLITAANPTVPLQTTQVSLPEDNTTDVPSYDIPSFAAPITYNEEQRRAIELILSGENCVIIGAAGSGKTTLIKGAVSALLAAPGTYNIINLTDISHKHLLPQTPGIIFTSYTRRAVNNLKKALPAAKRNCVTMHKVLEYSPVQVEVETPEGERYNSMRFEPTRHAKRKLDDAISIIFFDESGIIPIELYRELCDALESGCEAVQMVYLGDINQLPPVFGLSLLGVKGNELRSNTIELTQIYRQALESPIIRLAHRILAGREIPHTEFASLTEPGLKIHALGKRLSVDHALATGIAFIGRAYDQGLYDPETDMILISQNVGFGTIEFNKFLATRFAAAEKRVVWEIVANYRKYYFSIGDYVMYDKNDMVVTDIFPNIDYHSRMRPQGESVTLDYHGHNPNETRGASAEDQLDAEAFFDMQLESEKEEGQRLASHTIVLRPRHIDTDSDSAGEDLNLSIRNAGDIAKLDLGYSMTCHKAQGSEWKRVFILIHHSNARMINREWLYTAVTRAREQCVILCEKNTFENGIRNQAIKGQTLAEKFDFLAHRISQSEVTDNLFSGESENSVDNSEVIL